MLTNSIIIPGEGYLEPDCVKLLDELLGLIKSIIPEGESIKVSKLPFFNRIILVFSQIQYAQQIHDLLQDVGIESFYALRNNEVDDQESELLSTGQIENTSEVEPVNSRMPIKGRNRLEPPPNTIQLKSPPASPYLGWVNEAEDPPDEMTVTDPRSLADILYEPSECKPDELRRVFSRRGSINRFSDDEELEDFDLGEGENDVGNVTVYSKDHHNLSAGKKSRNMKPINIGTNRSDKNIPVLMIGNEEAEHLRAVSKKLESANHQETDL